MDQPAISPIPQPQRRKALIVLSGGQDSAVTAMLAQAEPTSDVIGAVHFQYGQRHSVEQHCAVVVASSLKIPLFMLPCNTFQALDDSALLRPGAGELPKAIAAPHHRLAHLPASFVPGRNLILLTFASALAQKHGAEEVWSGVCQTDYSGYPDCRGETVAALEVTLRRGLDFPELKLVSPLLNRSKAETFALAEAHGWLELVVEHTHTCYEGNRENRYAWGYGCGACPARRAAP